MSHGAIAQESQSSALSRQRSPVRVRLAPLNSNYGRLNLPSPTKWPHRIRANSPVFQAGNTGSSPVGAIRLMNEVEYPSGLRREPAKLLFVGSNPTSTSQSANYLAQGSIAQLAEQTALNRMVAGSTPATPTGYARLHRLAWLGCCSVQAEAGVPFGKADAPNVVTASLTPTNPLGVVVWEYSSVGRAASS